MPVLPASVCCSLSLSKWIWWWLSFHWPLETRHLSRHTWRSFNVYTCWPLFQRDVVVIFCSLLFWPISCGCLVWVLRLQVCLASGNNWPPLLTFPSINQGFLMSKFCPVSVAHKLSPSYEWLRFMIIEKSFHDEPAYSTEFDHVHWWFHYAAKFAFFKQNQCAFTKTTFVPDTIPFSSKWYLLHISGFLWPRLFYGILIIITVIHLDYRRAVSLPLYLVSLFQISGWHLLAPRWWHGNTVLKYKFHYFRRK